MAIVNRIIDSVNPRICRSFFIVTVGVILQLKEIQRKVKTQKSKGVLTVDKRKCQRKEKSASQRNVYEQYPQSFWRFNTKSIWVSNAGGRNALAGTDAGASQIYNSIWHRILMNSTRKKVNKAKTSSWMKEWIEKFISASFSTMRLSRNTLFALLFVIRSLKRKEKRTISVS